MASISFMKSSRFPSIACVGSCIFDAIVAFLLLNGSQYPAGALMGMLMAISVLLRLVMIPVMNLSTRVQEFLLVALASIQWGHVLACGFGMSNIYTENRPFGAEMYWLVIPISAVLQTLTCFSTPARQSDELTRETSHEYTFRDISLLAFASLSFAMAEGRVNVKNTPCNYFGESVIGFLTAAIFLSQVYKSSTEMTSNKSKRLIDLLSLIWMAPSTAICIATWIIYALRSTTRALHFRHGIAGMITFSYLVLQLLALLFRASLGKEDIFYTLRRRRALLADDMNNKIRNIDSQETVLRADV